MKREDARLDEAAVRSALRRFDPGCYYSVRVDGSPTCPCDTSVHVTLLEVPEHLQYQTVSEATRALIRDESLDDVDWLIDATHLPVEPQP